MDGQSTGVVGFHRVRDLRQLFLGGLTLREQALILEFHLACMMGVPMAKRLIAVSVTALAADSADTIGPR